MDKVSGDITKITQACSTPQENTGKINRECHITGSN